MRILSIHDGHNASAAIIDENGKVLACVSEERINRQKFFWGFPDLSIKYVLEMTSASLDDIEVVTVSHLDTLSYIKRKRELNQIFSINLKHFAGNLLNIFQAWKREQVIRNLFSKSRKKPVFFFCDHHLAHAASAYYFSGISDPLIVTIDWLGDSLSHTAYTVSGNKWKRLVSGDTNESVGAFYGAITRALGFTENRHEGKIVGLAAYGDANRVCERALGKFIDLSPDGLHFRRHGVGEMMKEVKDMLAEGYSREDISAYAQEILEEYVVRHINALLKISNKKSVALAGGVFANVKLNQRIMEHCGIEHIFIQPAMGDEGLVLGSARHFLAVEKNIIINTQMEHVYFGRLYSDEEIEQILENGGYKYERVANMADRIGDLLANGTIVGWFNGAMEFGPRSLGNRSILAHPKGKKINDDLNSRLKRSEFMPFAPSTLADKADEVYKGVDVGRHSAEFMTITFDVKKEWHDKVGAVVHVDGTARPQLVRRDRNPAYYDVIKSFYDKTGLPLVVNTSYNMHEEPIVSSPNDALKSFDVGAVDVVAMNNIYLVSKK